MSADSDFEEEVGGMYFDVKDTIWRCEDCSYELVNGKCPNGHEVQRCKTCGWQFVDAFCSKYQEKCNSCGGEMVEGGCLGCAADGDDEDEDLIAYDQRDAVWRCIYCSWEVEADNGTDGNCHCLNPLGEARYLDLSGCVDYEPADSCSSG